MSAISINFPHVAGRFRHDMENQRAQQYMINCTQLEENDTIIFWANRTYSQTGFQVIYFDQ